MAVRQVAGVAALSARAVSMVPNVPKGRSSFSVTGAGGDLLAGPYNGAIERTTLWSRVRLMFAVKGLFMEKWLCWGSMGVAGLLLVLFLVDAVAGVPFGGVSLPVDIFGILASALVLYLAYDAFRDLR